MNFIKKKLKSHKKDDEEEEYEKAVYEQSLHPQNPDQKNKNTEEWQFFQQLSMKVQDTVQKTQTTLNKLKDTVPNEEDPFEADNEFASREASYGTTKPLRAPPRPPAPSGDKSSTVDLDFGSDFSSNTASKLPPRPPPPGYSNVAFPSDSSALHGMNSKSSASPVRPPPPNPGKVDTTNLAYSEVTSGSVLTELVSTKTTESFNLLDEFGFKSDTGTTLMTSHANMQDLLFLDDKEEVDPFDTSFVNVTNIAPISSVSEIKRKESLVKSSESSFNPFSSSMHSNDWMTTSPTHSDKAKKTATNPFFTGDIKSESREENTQSSYSHNPFSFGNSNNVASDQDDFFGIKIGPSSSKENVTDDLFQTSEELPKSPTFECGGFVNSAFNDNIEPEQELKTDNGFSQQLENSVNLVQGETLMDEVSMWNSSKVNESSILSDDAIVPCSNLEPEENAMSSSSMWNSDTVKTEILLPDKFNAKDEKDKYDVEMFNTNKLEDTSSSKKQSNETASSIADTPAEEESLSASINELSEFPVPEEDKSGPLNAEKDISSEFFPNVSEDFSSISQLKRDSISQKESFSRKDSVTEKDASLQKESMPRRDSIPSRENIPRRESIPSRENVPRRESIPSRENIPRRESIPSRDNIPRRESIPARENIPRKDSLPRKESIPRKEIIPRRESIPQKDGPPVNLPEENAYSNFSESFKPFEKENDAFQFKINSLEPKVDPDFDAFAAKFESVKDNQASSAFDPFMSKRAPTLKNIQDNYKGFESMDEFDPFRVTSKAESSQGMMKKEPSRDSFEDYDTEVDFSVVIKPKVKDSSDIKLDTMEPPKLLPPPKTPTKAFDTPISRFNPFDKDSFDSPEISKVTEKVLEIAEVDDEPVPALGEAGVRKADSVETPLSPLFDEDTSQPLEVYPKPYEKDYWEMVLRQPNKKKLTGNRFWKKIIVKLSENSVLQLFNKVDDKLPFQELPLQACYSLSEIGAQQYDQYGKIFTVKLQYKFYRERVGVRPGQISKVTQGQVTSMGDVAKLGLPLQHSPQTSQLLKIGSQSYIDIKFFIQEVEDAIFRMVVHRDRVLTYKTEEVQVIAQDEFYVEQSKTGHIDKQLARVRIFFLAFITGMPSVEVGLNDIIRQGKEVVGRYDIIPVVTEEWIRLEDCEFHACVIQDEFYKNRVIKFHPPDACLFELLRFRIRPPKNRELPLQVRVFMTVSNTRVEIRSDILVPGYSSRKQGQVPCENIQIRFPVPECWIYLFRTEKHFRYGSKKSTARRPGKIKGLERIIGAAQNLDPSLIEVSAGQAKYEHVFHAVVWRIPRLPKEGQGAYTQQLFLLRTELTSFDQIPESFEQFVDVEFTMPATYVSHTTVRSVSVTNPIPPEKYVKYISKHEYKVEIDFKSSSDEIDGLIPTPNVPVSTTSTVQESTEDEEKDSD